MTLRRKIVALTLCLLLLFAMTAAASVLLQSKISGHFSDEVDDYLPLNATVATIDVFTDRYELDLRRLAAVLRDAGPAADLRDAAPAAAEIAQRGEVERLREAELLTTTFQKAEAQLDRVVQDPGESVEKRVAMADIRGRFGYMKRALPNFIDVGRRMSEALGAGRVDEARQIAAEFAPYRSLFGDDLTAVRDELAALTASAAEESYRLHRGLIILEIAMLGLASFIGLGLSLIVSNRMMAGLQRLIEGTRRIQDGNGYEVLPVMSNDEIGKLTVAFNRMVEDLRAKDRIEETFGKFVDPRIVANLIDPAGGKDLAERQVATVFFSDIKGFSGLGELLTATTLVKLLNIYFSEMTTLIHARNGIIDKFVGDGLMAFWTAPFSRGDSHASDACLAALAQQHAVAELRERLSDVLGLRRDLPEFSVRMGLATGDLVVGTIGAPDARSFTVIGDTVNLASRLEGANNTYETSILVDEETFQLAQNDVEGREIDFVTVLGKLEPVRVYQIMAPAGCLSAAEQELRGLFAEGLAAYRARDWERSERLFTQCLAVMPTDGPATVFRRRVQFPRSEALSADWDGVWRLTDK
jgi:adenylate cyclase